MVQWIVIHIDPIHVDIVPVICRWAEALRVDIDIVYVFAHALCIPKDCF